MTSVGKVTAEIRADLSKFSSDLGSAKSQAVSAAGEIEKKFSGVGSAVGSALKTGITAGAVAAAGVATAGLSAYKDLQSASSAAASKAVDVNGKSTAEIQAQYDSLLSHIEDVSGKLGAATIFSPTEVAKTYDVLASKGVDVAAVGESELLPFLNLASATQSDLASVTDLVTGSINSFGLKMSDSGMVADQIAMALNGSSASMETLNYALRQGGSTAAATGMEMSEFSAIVGTLADQNYTGEQSGAALKTAMLALYTPTQVQTDALTKLGLTYADVDPRTHKFTDTVKKLAASGADIGDFGQIFTDSSGAIMYALSGTMDKVDGLNNKIKGSSGLSNTQANLVMGTDRLVGAWETAKGAAEGMVTVIGQSLEPAAVKLLNAFSDMAPAIQDFATALIEGDWGKVGEKLSAVWDGIKEEASSAFSAIMEEAKSIDWGSVGSTAAELISSGISSGIEILSSLGSKVAGWLQNGGYSAIGSAAAKAFEAGWDALKSLGKTISGWIESQGDWKGIGQKVGGYVADGIKAVKTYADGIKDSISSWISGGGAKNLGASVGNAIANAIKDLMDLGKWIADSLKAKGGGSLIAGALKTAVEWVTLGAQAVGDFISGFVKGLTPLAAAIKNTVIDAVSGALKSMPYGVGEGLATELEGYKSEVNWEKPTYDSSTGSWSTGGGKDQATVTREYDKSKYSISQVGDKEYRIYDEALKKWVQGSYASRDAAIEAANRISATGSQINAGQIATNQQITTTQKSYSAEWSSRWGLVAAEAAADTTSAASTAASTTVAAAQQAESILVGGSQAAANALQLGSQVAANFTTQAGNAVKIGLNAAGQEIAVIGSVAQQRFTQAGGQLYTSVQAAGASTINSANQAGSIGINAANQAASVAKSTATQVGQTQTTAATTAAASTTTAGTTFQSAISSAGQSFNSAVGSAAAGWASTLGSVNSWISQYNAGGGNVSGDLTKSASMQFTDCFFEGFTDTCTNMNINALKYTSPGGQVSYINPMTYQDNGGISSYIGGSSSQKTASSSGGYLDSIGYTLPAVFRARGGLVKRPELAVIADRGQEMVLPNDITETILSLTRMGVSGGGGNITPSDVYLDGRKVGQIAFKYGTDAMRRKGMSIR